MLRVKAKFEVVVGVKKAATEAITREMEEATRLALHDWLEAVSGRVPIWSGMARGSLYSVARLIGGQLVLSPLRVRSRVTLGQLLGRAEINVRPGHVRFEFTSNVRHWETQETRNVGISKSAPWRALEAGREAFLQSFREHYRPPKEKLLKTKVITV